MNDGVERCPHGYPINEVPLTREQLQSLWEGKNPPQGEAADGWVQRLPPLNCYLCSCLPLGVIKRHPRPTGSREPDPSQEGTGEGSPSSRR